MTFDQAFERLIGHEGGYSNNPADPGGETMYGVTLRVARKNGYSGAMRHLPLSEAKRIAKTEYWDAVKADLIPGPVRFDVFDAAYHSGVTQAIKWVQRSVGILDDGNFGPKTAFAVSGFDPGRLIARFNGHRLDFLNDLHSWPTFAKGWTQRIAENLKGT